MTKNQKIKFKLAFPGGNLTALIRGIKSKLERRYINDKILEYNKEIVALGQTSFVI